MNLSEAEAYFIATLGPLCAPLHHHIEDAARITDGHLAEYRFSRRQGRHRTELLRIHLERLLEQQPFNGFTYDFSDLGSIELRGDDGLSLRLLHDSHCAIPAPGRNRARRRYWTNGPQVLFEDYNLSTLLAVFKAGREEEAEVMIARPTSPWPFKTSPNIDIHFRLPRTSSALQALAFTPTDEDVTLDLDFLRVDVDDE